MGARPTHDLAVKVGEYTDKDGQTKGRWLNIGSVFKHDDGGVSLKLESLPLGMPEWRGWVSVFPREKKDGQSQGPRQGQQRPQAAAPASFDDDLPF